MTAPNILIIGQGGRIGFEAILFAASLRLSAPAFAGRVIVAEPQPGPLWPDDPRLAPNQRAALEQFGADIRPFTSRQFGAAYPYGNKIEGLAVLPPAEPFVFFDSDTLITGALDAVAFPFARPAASMRREGTWPVARPGWPGHAAVWGSLYAQSGLDFAASQDAQFGPDDWRRYLYFNAGWFFGADPATFGARFLATALMIRDRPPAALDGQPMNPWLDQVALPLTIHALGGGRPGPDLAGLDSTVTCHWCWNRSRPCPRWPASWPPGRPLPAWSLPAKARMRGASLTAPTCPETKRPSASG
jgi:hypothetical protein